MPLKKAFRAAGTWRLPPPYPVQWLGRALLAPAGLALGVEQLSFLQYPWTVCGDKIRRELGFESRHTSAQAVAALSGGRQASAGEHDKFGMDRAYIHLLGKTLFRFLHDFWWRIEYRGLENVPREGRQRQRVGASRGSCSH